jgi:hypothetical protein
MVIRSYMLEKPPAPSAATRALHWTIVPLVINGLGALEGQLERAAIAVRRSPANALSAALALGLVFALFPRRRPRL